MIKKVLSLTKTTRFRITLWYSSLFLLMEILAGVSVYFYQHESLNRHLDISLKRQAETIYNFVSTSTTELENFIPDSIYSSPDDVVYDLIYESVTYNLRNTFIQVQSKNRVVFRTENLKGYIIPFPKLSRDTVKLLNFNNADLSPLTIRGAFLTKGKYKIIVAFPADLINETLDSLTEAYIVIAPLFFLISIVVGFVVSARSLTRIDAIIRKTDEITAQNLNEKIEGEEYDDEYGRLARKLNQMTERIRKSIEYMNDFSLSASHELMTPLTILRGELEIALRSEKSTSDYQQVLLSNYEETIRLINIVDRLFYISRIDSSLIHLNKQKIPASGFLEGIANSFATIASLKSMRTKFECIHDSIIDIDPEWMKQALFNLIDNAIKYGFENTEITIRLEKEENSALVSVINTGHPIPEKDLERIFDRFYRIDTSRTRTKGGAGLGLALAKSVVEWHQGQICAHSYKDGRTVIKIELNAVEEE